MRLKIELCLKMYDGHNLIYDFLDFDCLLNYISSYNHQLIITTNQNLMVSSTNSHAAIAQLYRWYQLYERDITHPQRIANQLDILDEQVVIQSTAGEMRGVSAYPEQLSAYIGWKNAHHIQQVTVDEHENGVLNLKADIMYQNIKPDGTEHNYSIHYATELQKKEGLLPIFTKISITPTGEIPHKPFEDAYPINRCKSLMYYWLVLMQQLDGNVEPFKELLAPDFTLNFVWASPITTFDQLTAWLQDRPMGLSISNHFPRNFIITHIQNHEFEMQVEFEWAGVTKEGKTFHALKAHTWRIIDVEEERFARIKKIDVVPVIPFMID